MTVKWKKMLWMQFFYFLFFMIMNCIIFHQMHEANVWVNMYVHYIIFFYILAYTGATSARHDPLRAQPLRASPLRRVAHRVAHLCSLPVITACGLKHLSFPLTEIFGSIIQVRPYCHHAALSWDVYMLIYYLSLKSVAVVALVIFVVHGYWKLRCVITLTYFSG